MGDFWENLKNGVVGLQLGLIGPRFEDSEKLTRRDLRPLMGKFASSLFGFVRLCFHRACKVVYFHNALLIRRLCSFCCCGNWVCFA